MPDEADSDGLSDEELDRYGYVSASERRVAVVTALRENPRTPKQLSERTDIRLNHVSNVLSELADEDVVTCVNPERKRGRVYRLTPLGETVSAEVASR
ncbi:winged helix-turn-helix domain-containing protein [Halobacterium sp. CBA1126]|uniref:winged helix-turn-helix domain-containing protein n=1 Tax=Halobacterium TaxID=2239 RepID=UPI0012FC3647|nr:winged helix-turn-helix domain-containing protein [Halobacterium sp. CBA1126]MUV59499.1 transcriptional regulator [Halobacterium sp. CBA1126]